MNYEKGQRFAWGSTIYEADGPCKVFAGVFEGETHELLTFEDTIGEIDAMAVCSILHANVDCLLIGSDSGYDEGAPENEEDADEATI